MDAEQVISLIRLSGLFTSALVITLTWLLGRGLSYGADRLSDSFSSQRLVIGRLSAFFRFAVYVLGTLLAVSYAFSLSSEVLTLLGGTLAVTLGLSLKDQASSVFAGIMILIEKPFQVGDRVSFGDYYGEIRDIGLRSVRLVTLDDNEVTIPNSRFLTEAVSSGNSGALTMLVQQDFFIGTDQDWAMAKRIISEALTTSPYFCPDLPWTVLINQVPVAEMLAIRLRAKAYVIQLELEKAFESDVTERVLDGFAGAGIGPPALLTRNVAARPEATETSVPSAAG
ncbi:MAG: mechanosensitive ion channel domain-containing protein [Myxococcota bacterium]